MKKVLLFILAAFAYSLSIIATTNMCIKFYDGKIVKYDVDNIAEVFYEKNSSIISEDTTAIDTSATPLRFGIIFSPTFDTIDIAVVSSPCSDFDSTIVIPSKVRMGGKVYPVTSIESQAFEGCSSLTSIEIPSGVTSIGSQAFEGCSSLTNIEIPSGVTSIGAYAFINCSGLTNIEIPSSVTSIGENAFNSCSGLTNIEIPSSVTNIGSRAFSGCSVLASINVALENHYYSSKDGILYDKEVKEIITAPSGIKGSIEIPSSVTSIGNDAFSGCSGLTSIEIPESVTNIGNYAFSNCSSLMSIKIPSGVTSIGAYAFINC